MADSSELERLQAELKQLREALPPLPHPDTLYAHISDTCLKVHALTEPIAKVGSQIDSLRRDEGSVEQRNSFYELLEMTVWKLQYQLLLYHTTLDNLLTLPPILVATHAMEDSTWQTKISSELLDIDDKPVKANPMDVYDDISTQLKTLERYTRALDSIEDEIGEQDLREARDFQRHVLLELQAIRLQLQQMERRKLEPAPAAGGGGDVSCDLSFEGPVDVNYPDYSDSGKDEEGDAGKGGPEVEEVSEEGADIVEVQRQEGDRIQQIAEFMEQVEEDEEVVNPVDLMALIAYELVEIDDAPVDEEPGQARPAEREVRIRPREEERPEDRVSMLRQELRQAEQARDDLDMLMRQLEAQERGPLRSFVTGGIRREYERKMPCIFCKARGHHYSDQCTVFRTARERERILADEGRCRACLDWWCQRGLRCRKAGVRCRYCDGTEHNSCVCEAPERYRRLQTQLEELQRVYERNMVRIHLISRRLEREAARDH
ncbi:hypothetical protein GCK32_022681 [Trichostrongylus colubriformis]|uniref:CCHC-type domain-containing protein n=1 Tax=Trichostrongylus colubriformis TaxID=6319 RepID=A0AAN8IL54_TRICO